ncbi:MAG: galactose mutarotase [Actinomycetia bacterium]|nr:galactose mutarotase [Actinomycetes bacterium]
MIRVTDAGRLPAGSRDEGADVKWVSLNSNELSVRLLGLGAAIASVEMRGSKRTSHAVHLGFGDVDSYADPALNPHLGSSIGRYANRIADAAFELDGTAWKLDANNGPNTLHGGRYGWDRHAWEVLDATGGDDGGTATFGFASPDGDMGFPGRVTATATFTLDGPLLRIEYAATTDAPTVVAMTNHGYWNLAGGGTCHDHVVTLAADEVLPVDDQGIPTGGLVPVEGTPFDLRSPTTLGPVMQELGADQSGGGFDHCFAVRGETCELRPTAVLEAPGSGRWMKVDTDQRGVQLYTGNNLGPPFSVHGAVSLETQAFPDSPNRPQLGSVRLDPDEEYRAVTEFTFGTGPAPDL